ncbi:MAG: hypothetical protein NT033_09350 [Candidatus Omnitrophica bacterium]|nr:hypothetical protein [Candidatus Omnitrophota bacterium]
MVEEDKKLDLFFVGGMSMFPFVKDSDYVFVKKTDPGELSCGDILVVQSQDNRKLCHRLVKIEKKDDALWFQTKGEGFGSSDEPVSQDRVIGKVIAIKRKGKFFLLPLNQATGALCRCEAFFLSLVRIAIRFIFKRGRL